MGLRTGRTTVCADPAPMNLMLGHMERFYRLSYQLIAQSVKPLHMSQHKVHRGRVSAHGGPSGAQSHFAPLEGLAPGTSSPGLARYGASPCPLRWQTTSLMIGLPSRTYNPHPL